MSFSIYQIASGSHNILFTEVQRLDSLPVSAGQLHPLPDANLFPVSDTQKQDQNMTHYFCSFVFFFCFLCVSFGLFVCLFVCSYYCCFYFCSFLTRDCIHFFRHSGHAGYFIFKIILLKIVPQNSPSLVSINSFHLRN